MQCVLDNCSLVSGPHYRERESRGIHQCGISMLEAVVCGYLNLLQVIHHLFARKTPVNTVVLYNPVYGDWRWSYSGSCFLIIRAHDPCEMLSCNSV